MYLKTHLSQTRTLLKYPRVGSGDWCLEHELQTMSPHKRQWCFLVKKVKVTWQWGHSFTSESCCHLWCFNDIYWMTCDMNTKFPQSLGKLGCFLNAFNAVLYVERCSEILWSVFTKSVMGTQYCVVGICWRSQAGKWTICIYYYYYWWYYYYFLYYYYFKIIIIIICNNYYLLIIIIWNYWLLSFE